MSESVQAEPKPSFWAYAWTWVKRGFRWIAAPLPAIIIVIVAVILVMLGVKNLQVGGILAKLFGKEGPGNNKKAVDVANTIPEDRVDKDGNLIQLGEPDAKGLTQAKVVPIETPGLFDDPSKVKIVPPGETEPVVVDLPDGVKAKDVEHVLVVKPEVLVVTVKDSSTVTPKDVDDLLSKYGG